MNCQKRTDGHSAVGVQKGNSLPTCDADHNRNPEARDMQDLRARGRHVAAISRRPPGWSP